MERKKNFCLSKSLLLWATEFVTDRLLQMFLTNFQGKNRVAFTQALNQIYLPITDFSE